MADRTRERRTSLIVDGPMQARLIATASLVPAAALSVTGLGVLWFVQAMQEEALRAEVQLENAVPLSIAMACFLLMSSAFLFVTSLKMSNKIAGPAYRLRKSMERMRGGDFAFTVRLRPGDQLQDLCDELNRVLDWLNANPPPGVQTRGGARDGASAEDVTVGSRPALEKASR